ncbi:MAG: adventurous gliding motility protein CglE [Deltaproteobacteria bacterium]|nr:adventurous gliding motility protein CglE [Deltaproteobacteria bacterium]
MTRKTMLVLVVFGLSAIPAAAGAQDQPAAEPVDPVSDETPKPGKPEPAPEPTALPKAEAKPDAKEGQPPPPAHAQKPAPAARADRYRIGRGLFIEANPGAFFSLGGEKGVSNAEPFMNAIFGWNFNADMALGLGLGYAANNNNAPKTDSSTGVKMAAPGYYSDYTVTFLDLVFSYYFDVAPRLSVPARVFAGGSFIANQYNADSETGAMAGDKTAAFQPNAGVASGIQYTTWQRHLQVGAEAAFFYIITDGIPSLAFYPSIKYNF